MLTLKDLTQIWESHLTPGHLITDHTENIRNIDYQHNTFWFIIEYHQCIISFVTRGLSF